MTRYLPSISLLLAYVACEQPSAPSPIAAPLRRLPWAQLNFLHTTDIHGWWGGHLQEPQYAADWGDYISFAKHLHARADADGSDLLLVDTGDRIEGNAIYDSSKPRGKFTYEIAKEQKIDLICSGNHELYKKASSEGEFFHTVPDFKDSYLSSNLDIYNPETGKLEALAPRFKKFRTKNQGIRILAFGFIFDFTGNANNTVIHKVEDTVNEGWFKEALDDDDLDLIVVFGHVDIRSREYATLFSAIRSVQSDLPIQFFGGHSHIRDYKRFDEKSVALESGRYMETIGFQSIEGLGTGGTKEHGPVAQKKELNFSRLYIDNNLFSMQHHSGKTEETFPTEHGKNVSAKIDDARKSLDLNHRYGCAPHDFWVNRRPYPHRESIFTWLEEQVLPDTVSGSSRAKDGNKAIFITNTGGIRFDIFQGPFTRDTKFLVSPFTSGVRFIKDVPYKAASRVLKLLNNGGPVMEAMSSRSVIIQPPENAAAWKRQYLFSSQENWQSHLDSSPAQAILSDRYTGLIPGYTTQDDEGRNGDDTLHSPIQFYNVPNCIQASVGFEKGEEPEKVDIMYNEFIEKWILMALGFLGQDYTEADAEYFLNGKSFTDIMTDWVVKHWHVDGECSK